MDAVQHSVITTGSEGKDAPEYLYELLCARFVGSAENHVLFTFLRR